MPDGSAVEANAVVGNQRAAIAARPLTVTISNVVNGLSAPLSGKLPTTPVDPPSPLSLVGLLRRETDGGGITSTARIAPTALLGPTSSLTYDPFVTVVDGVVTGLNDTPPASTLPLSYTVVSVPSGGGKIMLNPTTGEFSFLPYGNTPFDRSSEDVGVLVAEVTPFDTRLEGLPVVGTFVPKVLVILHQAPIVSEVLAPVIGDAEVTTIAINNAAALDTTELPEGTPLAFTTFVTSFDGTKISTNYFPALNLGPTDTAPTILNGPGLATAGNTDPNAPYTVSGLVPGLPTLRDGYNVVTWDPRGEFASGGTLQLDSPAYEGKDVSAIITWVAGQDTTKMDSTSTLANPDPLIGMVGGSYGGGIQLVAAGIDPRVDAIVPGIAWNNLTASLYPSDAFKTSYATLLLLSLVTTNAKINNQIYAGIFTGDLLGILTQSQQALLNSSGPDFLLPTTTTPTLFIQGTVDVLFPLQQSLANASQLNPAAPVKMIWFCGGHGACLDPGVDQAAQSQFLANETMDWLNFYVAEENPITAEVPGPKFQWIDNTGAWHSSDLLPDDPAFSTYVANPVGAGGFLPIVPVLGGSGPQSAIPIPYSLGLAAPAKNAVNTPIVTTTGDEIVGSPTVSFDYSGIGTTDHVYVQIVDKSTGLVVGNIVTPVDVTLDGKQHTATVNMEDIAYTVTPGTDLELQVVSSATPFLRLTTFGGMQISNVNIAMPIVNTSG